jgi:hypothetical protein
MGQLYLTVAEFKSVQARLILFDHAVAHPPQVLTTRFDVGGWGPAIRQAG